MLRSHLVRAQIVFRQKAVKCAPGYIGQHRGPRNVAISSEQITSYRLPLKALNRLRLARLEPKRYFLSAHVLNMQREVLGLDDLR